MVAQNWFVFALFGVGQLSQVDDTLGAVEPVQEFLLHLPPTIHKLGLQVGIPVKCNTSQHPDKLFYHKISVHASVVACFNEMCNMLFWVTLSIKLLDLWWLVAMGHVECINPLGIRLGV